MKVFISTLSFLLLIFAFNAKSYAVLSSFNLSSPAGGITIITRSIDLNPVTFVWSKSDTGAKYNFLFKNTLTYSDPPYLKFQSNNSGNDTLLTIRLSYLDSLLEIAGIQPGDSIKGVWRVRAYSTKDSLNSDAPDRQITFRRIGLYPLIQDFTTTIFPPPYWYLEHTGTSYWSRELPGAYGISQGSARFRFRSAPAGTVQTLISNRFVPIHLPNNYIRFNYAYRFYKDTLGVLAKDSLNIFGSTNNGVSWVLIKSLVATETVQRGYNSHTNLTTSSGTEEYTAPMNIEWATKVFQIPVGLNRIKFVAYSSNGNNLFIDDINNNPDGIKINSSIIPGKYSLDQNYPNPFNPSTKINFSIPRQLFVTLKIFDMLGREVAQLVNEELQTNSYSVDFNASNLPSGMYFYKLETAEFTYAKRMMLIK